MKMSERSVDWASAFEAVKRASSILVVTHIRPDGDAIGSALGVYHVLQTMGKAVHVVVDEGVPDYLRFLPAADVIAGSLDSGEWDLMISTDASDFERTGSAGVYGKAHSRELIVLDHHVTNTYFGDYHIVVPSAVSSTEIVFDWWQQMGVAISRDTATALLTGLVTDTLGFRTSSVTARTLEIAQVLLTCGASLTEVTARTLDSRAYKELELWKRVLPSADLQGQVIEAVIRQADLNAAGLDSSVDTGLVGFLNQVNEARIAVVFKEESQTVVRISMRSKRGYDVARVAFELGGGGHKQAAGATFYGTVEQAREHILPLLASAAAQGNLQIE
jgi:phosphoesterase RecJ-like protein